MTLRIAPQDSAPHTIDLDSPVGTPTPTKTDKSTSWLYALLFTLVVSLSALAIIVALNSGTSSVNVSQENAPPSSSAKEFKLPRLENYFMTRQFSTLFMNFQEVQVLHDAGFEDFRIEHEHISSDGMVLSLVSAGGMNLTLDKNAMAQPPHSVGLILNGNPAKSAAAVVRAATVQMETYPGADVDLSSYFSKGARRSLDRRAEAWVRVVPSDVVPANGQADRLVAGAAVLVGRYSNGNVWAISAKNSATGTEMFGGRIDEGAQTIKDPQWGTQYSLQSGEVVGKWCPSPPIIGGIIGSIFPQQGVWVPQVREQGGYIEVLVDVNAKAEFEKKYWKGILDAQGKADGGYY